MQSYWLKQGSLDMVGATMIRIIPLYCPFRFAYVCITSIDINKTLCSSFITPVDFISSDLQVVVARLASSSSIRLFRVTRLIYRFRVFRDTRLYKTTFIVQRDDVHFPHLISTLFLHALTLVFQCCLRFERNLVLPAYHSKWD